jgi:hypothetical protein
VIFKEEQRISSISGAARRPKIKKREGVWLPSLLFPDIPDLPQETALAARVVQLPVE